MPGLQHAKLYKIHLPAYPNLGCYIGSTTLPMCQRLEFHRIQYEKSPSGAGCCRSYILFQKSRELDTPIEISLLEEYPCHSREELHKREAHYIRTTQGVINKKIPGRNPTEYYADNRRKYQAINLAYYYRNQEICKQRARDYRRRLRAERQAVSRVLMGLENVS